jgi:hypothetical protein
MLLNEAVNIVEGQLVHLGVLGLNQQLFTARRSSPCICSQKNVRKRTHTSLQSEEGKEGKVSLEEFFSGHV